MALLPGSSAGGLVGPGQRPQPLSDINVTPFVDVMLVLLVIFMVTASMLPAGVDVDLPSARARQLVSDSEPVEISIDAGGQIFIGEARIAPDRFGAALGQLAEASDDPAAVRIFVRADRSLDYGTVMEIVSQVGAAGFSRVAFLSDPEQLAPLRDGEP